MKGKQMNKAKKTARRGSWLLWNYKQLQQSLCQHGFSNDQGVFREILPWEQVNTKIHLENLKHRWQLVCWQNTIPSPSLHGHGNRMFSVDLYFFLSTHRLMSLVKSLHIFEIRESIATSVQCEHSTFSSNTTQSAGERFTSCSFVFCAVMFLPYK